MEISEFIVSHGATIRMTFFVGIFVIVALIEPAAPRRPLITFKAGRWFANIGIVIINTVLLRLLVPAGAVGISVWIGRQGWQLCPRPEGHAGGNSHRQENQAIRKKMGREFQGDLSTQFFFLCISW